MRTIFITCIIFLLSIISSAQKFDPFNATALLFSQEEDGGMKMRCTITAFQKISGGYRLVSASHCVSEDDKTHERAEVDQTTFYVTFDESKSKTFQRVEVTGAGYQSRGDDFAVMELKTDAAVPVIPLGDEQLESSRIENSTATYINIASPGGLGKQTFEGKISKLDLDRPVFDKESGINWKHMMLIDGTVGPGSSGSSLISNEQKAIVGFVIGNLEGGSGKVAIPVSRFKKFLASLDANTYKYFNKDADFAASNPQAQKSAPKDDPTPKPKPSPPVPKDF